MKNDKKLDEKNMIKIFQKKGLLKLMSLVKIKLTLLVFYKKGDDST